MLWAGAFAFGIVPLMIALKMFVFHIPGGTLYHFTFLLTSGLIARLILIMLLRTEVNAGYAASKRSLSKLVAQPLMKPTDKNEE